MPQTKTMTVTGLPRVFDGPIQCPAGEFIAETVKGSGCRCRVEDSTLLAATDPSSLASYCLSLRGHQECPSWRADKEAWWAERRAAALD